MNKKALLAAAAAAALAAAQTAQAQDQSGQPQKQPPPPRPQLQHPTAPHGAAQGQHAHDWTGQPGQVAGHPSGGQPPRGAPPKGQGQAPHWQGQGQSGQHQWQGQVQSGQHQWQGHPGGRPNGGEPWGQQPGGGHAPQSGHWNAPTGRHFDRHDDSERWTETRHAWRGEHGGWSNNAPWRRDHDWWRDRREFHGYTGARIGFWFAPGYGYYHVPESYWDRQWGPGDYLPAFLWEYQVADWEDYDLPPPPEGCGWVWINGGVALIDLSDGYVLDVQYGLW